MCKNLVIVDIQKMFEGYMDEAYLEKVQYYIENEHWENVVVIVNEKEYKDEADSLEYVPGWLARKATHIVFKFLNDHFYERYIDDLMSHGYKEVCPNSTWRKEDSLLIRTPTVHKYFYVPKELQDLSQSIQECTLIGGAVGYCLEDIKTSLEYLGVHVDVHKEYTYALGDWQGMLKDVEWVTTKKQVT